MCCIAAIMASATVLSSYACNTDQHDVAMAASVTVSWQLTEADATVSGQQGQGQLPGHHWSGIEHEHQRRLAHLLKHSPVQMPIA